MWQLRCRTLTPRAPIEIGADTRPHELWMDDRLTEAVHLRFGLPPTLPVTVKKAIKRADRISAWAEAIQIAGFTRAEANRFFGAPRHAPAAAIRIVPRPPMAVKADFLDRFAMHAGAM